MEVTLDRPEIVQGFSTILLNIWLSTSQRFPDAWRFWISCWVCFCRLKTFPFAWKLSTEVFAPQVFFRLWVGSWNSWSRPDNFAVQSAIGKINTSPFCGVHTSVPWILRGWISDASICPSSSRSATRISPFQIPQRLGHVRRIFPVALSYQIGGALTCLLKKSDNIQPLHQKVSLHPWMVLRIAFRKEFSRRPGGLGHFADSNNIP